MEQNNNNNNNNNDNHLNNQATTLNNSINGSLQQQGGWMASANDILFFNSNNNNNNNSNLTSHNIGIDTIPTTLNKQDTVTNIGLMGDDWSNARNNSFSSFGFLRNSMSNSQNFSGLFNDLQQQGQMNQHQQHQVMDQHQINNQQMMQQQHQIIDQNQINQNIQHLNQQQGQMNQQMNQQTSSNHQHQQQQFNPYINNTTNNNSNNSNNSNNNVNMNDLSSSNPFNNGGTSLMNTSSNSMRISNNNIGNSSPMKEDDYEDQPTPPTPPLQSTPIGTPPIVYSSSFIMRQPSMGDPISHTLGQHARDYEPSEYESQPKLQRTSTYDAQITKLPETSVDFQINLLRSHTERIEGDVERLKHSSNSNLSNSSFLLQTNYPGTNTEKISQEFYNSLIQRYHERNDRFLKAKEKQVKVVTQFDLTLARELQVVYTDMKKHIEEEKTELRNLLSKTILQPPDLHQIKVTIEGLKSHHRIVDVLYSELQYILSKKKPESCCAIIILSQPPSQVIFAKKSIQETYEVEMVTGVVAPDNVSTVSVKLERTESGKKEKTAQPLENNECDLDKQNKAKFSGLKVNVSTRMTPTPLKFVATVRDKSSRQGKMVESVQTNPVLIITNESQWAEAAGKIMMGEAFEDREEITWELFANILHSHLFIATGQTPYQPTRKLHTWEFDYIQQTHFGGKPKITRTEAKEFWVKFGPVLQTIHFKRHISTLWFDGLIYGLISKNECNSILYNVPEGSFLIRFSDSLPGSFAIAYVTNDDSERVKHFLVKPEEIGANKTLPDYLRERFQFKILYVVDPPLKTLTSKDKDTAFAPFYSKRIQEREKTKTNPGYVSGL